MFTLKKSLHYNYVQLKKLISDDVDGSSENTRLHVHMHVHTSTQTKPHTTSF